jgi:hypothetical protein
MPVNLITIDEWILSMNIINLREYKEEKDRTEEEIGMQIVYEDFKSMIIPIVDYRTGKTHYSNMLELTLACKNPQSVFDIDPEFLVGVLKNHFQHNNKDKI